MRYTKAMRQSLSRVLVVYKKSAYQLYVLERRDPRLSRLLRRRHPDAREIRQAHAIHQATLRTVTETLARLGLAYDVVYRAHLRTTARYDLVISVGGDGTLLQASHLVADLPILGVNSDPRRSEAVFCAATRANFPMLLRQALAGHLPVRRLSRLQATLNGRPLWPLVLNDVLIAHRDPATMSRYRLAVGAHRAPPTVSAPGGAGEEQKSSGVWVATAAGSSSAILAAGGRRLPWTARRFQYRPRELYEGRLSRSRLTGGVVPAGRTVSVTWLMREGAVFIDGPHVRYPLRFGDRIVIGLSTPHPLRVLGLRR